MLRGKAPCHNALISFRSTGNGSDVILIHGLAANHAFWRLSLLLALAKEHRVTVFDLRGHGNSSMPSEGYTVEDLAEDLHCLYEHLNISSAHLIGHSLGGAVALQFAQKYPEKVHTLTIADSRVRSIQPVNFARAWPLWEKAKTKLSDLSLQIPEDEPEAGFWLLEELAKMKFIDADDSLKGSSLAFLFGGWSGGRRTARNWLQLIKTTTAKEDFLSTPDVPLEQLRNINLPVFAIYGELSSSLPSLSGLHDYLPQCHGEVIEGAGHFFPFTRVEIFTEAVCRFLKQKETVT